MNDLHPLDQQPLEPTPAPFVSDDEKVEEPTPAKPPIEEFAELIHDPEILEALKTLGWAKPTLIQAMCLPDTFEGRDLAGFAQTGTGKTGVFLLTLLHRLKTLGLLGKPENQKGVPAPAAFVLLPTRELAMQVAQDSEKLLNSFGIKAVAVYGGVDVEEQAKTVRNAQVIMATPGRLKDFFQRKKLTFDHCKIMVCDEADRMFDMGFIDDVEYFLDKIPEDAQKLLFSATTNDKVKELAFEYLTNPLYVSAHPEEITPENITQFAIRTSAANKLKVLMGLLRDHSPERAIIFVNTKMTAEWLHYKLDKNDFNVKLITGDLPQKKRISLIHDIKAGKVKILIATDVASRGLHISDISHVYNFDIPEEPSSYVHRIGRTARAGAKGSSYSLVCEDYGENWIGVLDLIGTKVNLPSIWYDDRYDSIADLAGNPYQDPEFRANRKPPERPQGARGPQNRDGARPQRHGGRSGKPFEQRAGSSQGSSRRPQERDGAQRRPQHERDGQPRRQDRQRDFSQGGKQQHQRHQQQGQRRHDNFRGQVARVPEKLSFFGQIKAFFRKLLRLS